MGKNEAMTSVLISYSHKDTRWLSRLVVHLRPIERAGLIDLWADTRTKAGEDWVKQIEAALAEASVAILLVSADFLASEFITSKELPAVLRKARLRDCKILPLIVAPCLFSHIRDLQQFQAVNSPERPLARMRRVDAEAALVKTAEAVLGYVAGGESGEPDRTLHKEADVAKDASRRPKQKFTGDPRVDALIKGVRLGDWHSAAEAALKVVALTDGQGRNQKFERLLGYQDCPDDDDRFWGAVQTVESCIRLAPWLIDHAKLSRMAAHKNFSVRSSAASICMDLAHSAPDRVPLDILLKLSVYDEDWYVQAPANAALKAMARSFPAVLRVFYVRLHSTVAQERAHAAAALEDVAQKDPGLLEPELLAKEFVRLRQMGDASILSRVRKVFSVVKSVARADTYRYGL
jgi:hypothetical protein